MNDPDYIGWTVDQWQVFMRTGDELGSLPFPLTPCTDGHRTEDDRALAHRTIHTASTAEMRVTAQQVADTLRSAVHTVSIYGGATSSTGTAASPDQLRAHISVTDRQAAIIGQVSGDTAETGGMLVIWHGDRALATDRLAQLLPPLPAATGPVISASLDEIEGYKPGRNFLDPTPTDGDQILALAKQRRSSDITIQCDRFIQDKLLRNSSHHAWIGLADKGSYLLEQFGEQFTLTPADAAVAAKFIMGAIPRPEVPLY